MPGYIYSSYPVTEPQGGSDRANFRAAPSATATGGGSTVRSGPSVIDPAAVRARAAMFLTRFNMPGVEVVREVGMFTDPYKTGAHPWIRFNNVPAADTQRPGAGGRRLQGRLSRLGCTTPNTPAAPARTCST
jgi:acyl-CoA dehydrogenase